MSALTGFQHLIIIKILRPECLVESVRLFVKEQLGSMFVTSLGFDLQEIFEESSNRKPLIFVLSPGKFSVKTISRANLSQVTIRFFSLIKDEVNSHTSS